MRFCDALRASLAIVRAGLSGAGGRFCAAGAFGPAALRLYPSLLMYNRLTSRRRFRWLLVCDLRVFPVDFLTAGGLLPRRLSFSLRVPMALLRVLRLALTAAAFLCRYSFSASSLRGWVPFLGCLRWLTGFPALLSVGVSAMGRHIHPKGGAAVPFLFLSYASAVGWSVLPVSILHGVSSPFCNVVQRGIWRGD